MLFSLDLLIEVTLSLLIVVPHPEHPWVFSEASRTVRDSRESGSKFE